MTSLLEKIYKRLIRESHAQQIMGLAALVYIDNKGNKEAVIYDPNKAISYLENDGEQHMRLSEEDIKYVYSQLIIKGLITIRKSSNPCNGAEEVAYSAGPGFGKTVYGLGYALSDSGILIPDRKSVSKEAQAAWAKVYANPQRKKKPLDNVNSPDEEKITPGDPSDDCKVHNPWKSMKGDLDNPINYSYESEGWEKSMLDYLKTTHEQAMADLPPKQATFVETALKISADRFFSIHYK